MIELRDYQCEAVDAIERAYSQGVNRTLTVLPTGAGKTLCFIELLRRRGERGLILIHRNELLDQTLDKFSMLMPDTCPGVVKADRNDVNSQVIIASIQTLARENRLQQLPKDIKVVIADEAHHSLAPSWKRVLEHLEVFRADSKVLLAGFTATADRSDGQGLSEIYQQVAYSKPIVELMKRGYLSDATGLQVRLSIDFDALHTRYGDFQDGELSEALEKAGAPTAIADALATYAPNRKSVVFVPSVALAYEVASACRTKGFNAEGIDGTTPTEKRRAIIDRLHRGETQIVANAMLLTEGFDSPSVDCIVVARPTKSRPLYQQMIGRGLRLHPTKQNCLVIDLTGSSSKHSLWTIPKLFGLQTSELAKGRSVLEAIEEQERQQELQQQKSAAQRLLEANRYVQTQEIDLFRRSQLHWIEVDRTCYTLPSGDGLIVLKERDGLWNVTLKTRDGKQEILADRLSLPYAQGAAESRARKTAYQKLSDPNAPWRIRPASEKQIATMRKMRIRFHPRLTSGEASDLIASKLAR
jgi:ATP-dependent helicase IRC3